MPFIYYANIRLKEVSGCKMEEGERDGGTLRQDGSKLSSLATFTLGFGNPARKSAKVVHHDFIQETLVSCMQFAVFEMSPMKMGRNLSSTLLNNCVQV